MRNSQETSELHRAYDVTLGNNQISFGKILSPNSTGQTLPQQDPGPTASAEFLHEMNQRRLKMEAELNALKRYEGSVVKKRTHHFSPTKRSESPEEEDPNWQQLDHRTRGQLSVFFDAWLTHSKLKKQKWQKMVKVKYLLGQLKLNRIICKWKEETKRCKLQKVKIALVNHRIYRINLKACFQNWKRQKILKVHGCAILRQVILEHQMRVFLSYLKYRVKDQASKKIQARRASKFFNESVIPMRNYVAAKDAVDQLRKYAKHRLARKERERLCCEIHKKATLRAVFWRLQAFIEGENKKLLSKAKVERYLVTTGRDRKLKAVLIGLKRNMTKERKKDSFERAAAQFNLYRCQAHYPMLSAFNRLKDYRRYKSQKNQVRREKVYLFRLRRFFRMIALNTDKAVSERQRAALAQVYKPNLEKAAITGLQSAVKQKQDTVAYLNKRVEEEAMRKALQGLRQLQQVENENIRIEDPFQPLTQPMVRKATEAEGWKTHQMGAGLQAHGEMTFGRNKLHLSLDAIDVRTHRTSPQEAKQMRFHDSPPRQGSPLQQISQPRRSPQRIARNPSPPRKISQTRTKNRNRQLEQPPIVEARLRPEKTLSELVEIEHSILTAKKQMLFVGVYKALKKNVHIQNKKMEQYKQASRFCHRQTLKKGFSLLRNFREFKMKEVMHQKLAVAWRTGKLREKYYRCIQQAYEESKANHVKVRYLAESRMTYHCFNALLSYSRRRDLKRQNNGMAYIKWRQATTLKTLKALRKYAQRRKVKTARHEGPFQAVKKLVRKRILRQVVESLQLNRVQQLQKKRVQLRVDRFRLNFVRRRVLACLKRNVQLNRFQEAQNYKGEMYAHNVTKLKVFESLKFYAFTLAKRERIKHFRALKFWAKHAKLKAFFALQAYMEQKKSKKASYSQAFESRKDLLQRQAVHQMFKVGHYWLQRNPRKKNYIQYDPFIKQEELESNVALRKAFWKWHTMAEQNRSPRKAGSLAATLTQLGVSATVNFDQLGGKKGFFSNTSSALKPPRLEAALLSKVEDARSRKQKEEQDVMEWLNSFSVEKVQQQKQRVMSFGAHPSLPSQHKEPQLAQTDQGWRNHVPQQVAQPAMHQTSATEMFHPPRGIVSCTTREDQLQFTLSKAKPSMDQYMQVRVEQTIERNTALDQRTKELLAWLPSKKSTVK